jgi:hypothetical protein
MLKLKHLLVLFILALTWTSALAQGDAQPTQIGRTVEGSLTQQRSEVAFQFAATANQLLEITLRSAEFDTYLTLRNAEGDTLQEDDDSAGDLDSRITVAIPADGLYTVVASSFNDGVGAFALDIEEIEIRRIEYGMEIEGELTEDTPSEQYLFRGSAGDTILITLSSNNSDWDPYLNLYSGIGESQPLVSNDDGAGSLNARIGPYTLPEDGIYTIEATSFGGSDGGEFILSFERPEITTIGYGDSAEGSLTEDTTFLYYQFEAEAGDLVDISAVNGAEVGTALILNSVDGFQLQYSDSYSGVDPQIRAAQLPSSGTYTIIVRTLEEGDTGDISITLEPSELASLDDGEQTIAFSDTVTRHTLTFTGSAGEEVSIDLRTDGQPFSSLSITILQSGMSINYISGNALTRLTASFIVPEDGIVLVQVEDFSYQDIEYKIRVDR